MHAIIPVAGVGTRLRPHTYTLPKVLLNVAGKPILGHILDKLIKDGVTSATIVVGYMGDLVERYVRSQFAHLKVNFVTQEELLGLGHSIFDVDLRSVFSLPTNALGVKTVEDPRRFGVVEMNGEFISRIVEKPEHPKTNLAVVGLYFIRNPKLLMQCLDELVQKDVRTKNEYQLTDALQHMIELGESFSTFAVDAWYDCGKPETLLSTNRHLLLKRANDRTIAGVITIQPVSIAPSAEIENSIIGPYATIGEGAAVRDSIIRDSIIGDGCVVQSVLLEASIAGNNTTIRSGFRRINAGDSSEIDFQ